MGAAALIDQQEQKISSQPRKGVIDQGTDGECLSPGERAHRLERDIAKVIHSDRGPDEVPAGR